MQRDPYVLEEEADSGRKDVIDPYGTNTHTLWRLHGWRMSLYSLARARGMHGRHYMFTRISSNVDLGACLAPRGSVKATVAAVFVPILASNSALRCPPSAHSCCCCPVSRALGGSHGAAIMCAERTFLRLRPFSVASAAAGFTKLGLLLWRSGAPEHFICELLAFGAAFPPNFLSVPLSYVPAIARSRSLPHAASARGVNIWGRSCVRGFALIAA